MLHLNEKLLGIVFFIYTVNLFNINSAYAARAQTPVDPLTTITQSFAKWNGIGTRNYHVAIDYGVGQGTLVRAGVNGRISNIVGLDHRYNTDNSGIPIGSNHNDCPNNQEKIMLWDSSTQIESGKCTGRQENNNFFGITVIVKILNDDGTDSTYLSLYSHLSAVNKELWEAFMCSSDSNWDPNCSEYISALEVSKETIIGKSGGSGGRSLDRWPNHLHYEIRNFLTRGTPSRLADNDPPFYFGYTPDLPQGYGYEDPKSFFFKHPNAELLINGVPIEIVQDDVAIRSGPGTKYSVLGRTGSSAKTSQNQIFIAVQQVTYSNELEENSGDTVGGRIWYRIQLPHSLGITPVFGWIAASDASPDDRFIKERTDLSVYSVEGLDSKGYPILLDYKKGDLCEDPVKDLSENNCARIFAKENKYLAVKIWNGMKFAIVPQADGKFDPVIDDNGKKWYQVYIPELYFNNPGDTVCSGDEGVQCKGDITTAWIPADKLKQQSIDNASGSMRMMDFENGSDRVPIKSTIPGLVFTTTQGYDWIYADWREGYNGPYPNGSYFSNGHFFAWLGENQGLGRIDFTGGAAATLSLGYSSASTVNLQACVKSENWGINSPTDILCKDGLGYQVDAISGLGNLNTGRLDRLTVSANRMDYALFHDSGNFWLIDDLGVSDLLGATQSKIPSDFGIELGETFAMSAGQTKIVEFMVDFQQSFKKLLRILLNWPGSEFRLEIYDPEQQLVAARQSRSAPIAFTLDGRKAGVWHAKITAIDIPYNDYPVSLVIATKEIEDIIDVLIDVKPDNDDNIVNIRSKGVIPVAIFSTETFDVRDVNQSSLTLAGAYARARGNSKNTGSFLDLNNDGFLDLIVHFPTSELDLDLDKESTAILLKGLMIDGTPIQGIDQIKVVP